MNTKRQVNYVKMLKLFAVLLLYKTALAEVKIASGSKLGMYHTIATEECQKIEKPCSVVITSGSRENIKLLMEGKVDFAIIQDNLGLANMSIVKRFPVKEHLHIFHKKDVESFSQLMNEAEYSVDVNSGTYAILFALQKALNFKLKVKHRDIQDKEGKKSFCDRDTEASFYNIAESSYRYQQIQFLNLTCNAKEYQFTQEEQDIIRKTTPQLTIRNGLIENGVIMVKLN